MNTIRIFIYIIAFLALPLKGIAANSINSDSYSDLENNNIETVFLHFQQKDSISKNCKQKLSGTVFLNATQKIVGNALIKLKDANGNVMQEFNASNNAKYNFEVKCGQTYKVEAFIGGYDSSPRLVKTSKKNEEIINKNLFVTPQLKKGETRKFLQRGEVDFEYNEWKLESHYIYELDKAILAMKDNPKLFIHFESHTDSRAKTDFNWNLTDKRIAVLIEYLGYNKIFRKRISGQSFGESKPINKCVKGVKCTDWEYLVNRRSTFILTEKKTEFTQAKRPAVTKDTLGVKKNVKLEKCRQQLEGTVFLNATRRYVGNGVVSLRDDKDKLVSEFKTKNNAKYNFSLKCFKDYTIESSIPGYEDAKRVLKTSVKDKAFIIKDLFVNLQLKKGEKRESVWMGEVDFEYNKWNLLPRYMYELDKAIIALKANPKLYIHFESHTDSRGKSDFNWELTDKRIAVLQEYLGYNKIFRKRISGQSFGETKPLNKCVKGVKCDDKEYLVNRRTSFILTEKKVQFTPIKRVAKDSIVMTKEQLQNCRQTIEGTVFLNPTRKKVGNALITLKNSEGKMINEYEPHDSKYKFILKCDTNYTLESSILGYEDSKRVLKTSLKDKKVLIKNLFVNKKLREGEKRKHIAIGGVDFEYNEWKLLPRYMYELDKAISIMKENKDLFIHFESHTDSRSKRNFNWELTDKRVAILKEYLGYHKIRRTRVSGQSFGETKPINKCVRGVKCTDKEFLENRRTTFVLTERKVEFTPIKRATPIPKVEGKELTLAQLKNCRQEIDGAVFIENTNTRMRNVLVFLKNKDGVLIKKFKANNGKYHFELRCNLDYILEATLKGFEKSKDILKSGVIDKENISKDLFVKPKEKK